MADINLKPQDFKGLSGKEISCKSFSDSVITAISNRTDMSAKTRNYLTELVKFAAGKKGATSKTVSDAYKMGKPPLKNETKIKNAIQKDFSELMGPILIHKLSSSDQRKYGLNIKDQSKVFIPLEGNYPLIDFWIADSSTGKRSDFSVKLMGKTSNVIKSDSILGILEKPGLESIKRQNQTEYKILEIIAENSAKHGPMAALMYLYDSTTLKSELPFDTKNKKLNDFKKLLTVDTNGVITGGSTTNETFKIDPDKWWLLFEPIIDKFYAKGKSTLQNTWNKKYYEAVVTILCQYTVAAVTKELNWEPFVTAVKKEVSYFKFELKTDGTFNFVIENAFAEEGGKQGVKKYALRAKSRISATDPNKRAAQDKLGLQP